MFCLGLMFLSFFVLLSLFLFVACRGLLLDLEYNQCGPCSLCLLVLVLSLQGVLLGFTMPVSSGDDGSVLECAGQGPGSAA